MKGNTLAIVLLVVGLVVGAGAGYYLSPSGDGGDGEVLVPVNPLAGTTIQIGYISPQTSDLERDTPLMNDIVGADINEYFNKMDYDVDVEFLIDTADAQAAIHLEKVQSFKSMDISIFMGGAWSSQAQAAISYVNDNDMLMISWSSTSPLLSIPDDRLFRTCPTDYVQAPAIGNMLESWGIDAVLILQRGDSWADGIYNVLVPVLEEKEITVIERVRYAAEVTEYSSYLATIDDIIGEAIAQYGAEHVAIQTMCFDEEVVIVTQTVDYPNTRAVKWFGTETSGRNQRMLDGASGLQAELGYFSSLMTPATSWKWESLQERYMAATSQAASFYTSADYDAAWCLALSAIEAGSVDASKIAPLWPTVPRNFFGASGWVDLDENGDRKPRVFDIWGYTADGEAFTTYGQYNGAEITIQWYDDVLAANGHTRSAS